jgi:hypothetical protein
MISIIISSYNETNYENFLINIENTIGIKYEIIKIINPSLMGICAAYNLGSKKANFNYLCFVHDDIFFDDFNWGNKIIEHFENNKDLGLLGVAGSSYKPLIPSGWSFPQDNRLIYMNLTQPKETYNSNVESNLIKFINKKTYVPVATIDGCFMVTLKSIYEETKFDEQLFKKYHCYDIDFSIAIGKKYIVAVVNNINLIHYSKGKFDATWIDETIKLHKKWNNVLPIKTEKISYMEIKQQEIGAFEFILRKSIEFNYPKIFLIKMIINLKTLKHIGLFNLIKCTLRIFYYSLKQLLTS